MLNISTISKQEYRGRRLKIERNTLEALYVVQGLTCKDIGRLFEVAAGTILNAMRWLGIPSRPNLEAIRLAFEKKRRLDPHRIISLYQEGYLLNEIAEMMHCSSNAVNYYLKRYGIARRSLSESHQISIKKGRAKFHSREEHWNWKGGKWHSGAYIKIPKPGHPRSDRYGFVLEHIVVWEDYYGKALPAGWVIHHLNGVKDDNHPENLAAMPNKAHSRKEMAFAYKKRIRKLEAEIKYLKEIPEKVQLI